MRGSQDVAFASMLAGVGVPIGEIREHTRAGGYEIYARLATGESDAESLDLVRGKGPEIWKVGKSRTRARPSPLVRDLCD